jgi:hypothetical protein
MPDNDVVNYKHLQSLAEHSDVYRDSQRVAIIDMGSNSFRLIVVEYVPHLSFKVTDEVRESVRLSEGMADEDIMNQAAMDRAARVMRIYAAFCEASGITDMVAVGTSAIRDARNRAYFLKRVMSESHIPVRVLSGDEEAYYAYLASKSSALKTAESPIRLVSLSVQCALLKASCVPTPCRRRNSSGCNPICKTSFPRSTGCDGSQECA